MSYSLLIKNDGGFLVIWLDATDVVWLFTS